MRPVQIAAPGGLPVDLAQLKQHAREEFDTDDSELQDLLNAAVDHLDGYSGILGRCLMNQDWGLQFPGWSRVLRLPFPNVSAATVKYLDSDDVEQELPATGFELLEDALGSYVRLRDDTECPALGQGRSNPVSVEFTAGYGAAAENVPNDIKVAILALARHWYERLEGTPPQMALLSKYRWVTS